MATPVEEVKARLDAVEYIGRDVRLQRAGRNWKGLCPFHSEKTPSFFVFPDRGSYKCFGCGEGGDLLTYVMRRNRIEFPDALGELAREAGIEIQRGPADPERRGRQNAMLALLAEAQKFLHRQLLESPAAEEARVYVRTRGLADKTVAQFGLGYASAHGSPLLAHLRRLDFKDDAIEAAGLARSDERGVRDYLFDRLIFPIWNRSGAVVGFGGRTLRDIEPKYLNTRDSEVFTKGHLLYGYHLARDAIREERTAVIVEGYMDVIAAHEAGFTNTVASMGTSLTAQQARMLTTSGASRVVIALDADAAGAAAARRGLDVVREAGDYESGTTVDVRGLVRHEDRLTTDIGIAELPVGDDPDSLVRSKPERWRDLIASPTPLADFAFRWAGGQHDLGSLSGRRAAMRELLPIVSEIGDAVVRAHYFGRLSELSGVPVDELRRMAARDGRRGAPRAAARSTRDTAAAAPMLMDRLEEGLLRCVARASVRDAELISRLDPALLTDPAARHILARIVAQAREHDDLDWERIGASLDPTSQQRLTAVLEGAAEAPGSDASLGVELQFATLRLRERRLNAELEETRLAADGDAAEPIAARRQELISEMDSVHRAKLELIGARSMATG
ncbi:MAG: DNA primase [Chloroflexota bacterium]|nr:DNA primase [Chloroflexota bacterium]